MPTMEQSTRTFTKWKAFFTLWRMTLAAVGVVPVRTDCFKHCFVPRAINEWNSLPIFVVTAPSIEAFMKDIYTGTVYALEGQSEYAILTVVLLIGPTTFVNIISRLWHIHDGHDSSTLLWGTLLGTVHRHWRTFQAGRKTKSGSRDDLLEWYQCESDSCLLALYASFLQAAPQTVLQMYVMMEKEDSTTVTPVLVIKSLVLLAMAVTSYDEDLQLYRSGQEPVPPHAYILQLLWRLNSITSRIFAMVLVARAKKWWLFFGFFFTIVLLVMFVSTMKRAYGSEKKVPLAEDFSHTLAVSAAFTFGFLNVYQEGAPITAVQHSLLLCLLNIIPLSEYMLEQFKAGDVIRAYSAEFLVIGLQMLGWVFMGLYYACYPQSSGFMIPFRIFHKEKLIQTELRAEIDTSLPAPCDRAPGNILDNVVDGDNSLSAHGVSTRPNYSVQVAATSTTPLKSATDKKVYRFATRVFRLRSTSAFPLADAAKALVKEKQFQEISLD